MSRRRYKVRLQPLFGKRVIAGAPVFDFLLPYCKSIHSMPIFAVFLCLLTKKANFRLMLAAEDYVDGVSRKLQPVIRNDDKRYAACRRIFCCACGRRSESKARKRRLVWLLFGAIYEKLRFLAGFVLAAMPFSQQNQKNGYVRNRRWSGGKMRSLGRLCGVYFLSGAASGFFLHRFCKKPAGNPVQEGGCVIRWAAFWRQFRNL